MADVFIVHHRADRAFVARLGRGMQRKGLRPNRRFDHTLIAKPAARAAMDASDAIVVVWSQNAAEEDLEAYVRFSPAATPLHFVSVACDAPLDGFERARRHDLTGWRSDVGDPDFCALAESLPRRKRGKKAKNGSAPVMSVIVQNEPRNASLPAEQESKPGATTRTGAGATDDMAFEISSGPRKDRPLMIAAGALVTAAACVVGFVAFVRPGASPAPAEAAVATNPPAMAAPIRAAPLQPGPLEPIMPEAGEAVAAAAAADPRAAVATRGRLASEGTSLRGRLPVSASVSESALSPASELVAKPPASTTPPLAPAHLRERIVAAPASSVFLLAPDMRATVERARGSATRGAEVAETALVSAGPGMRTAQLSSGSLYAGQWSAGGANGVGASRSRDGTEYAGSWRNSRPHGRGVLLRPNGVRYDGEFANGTPTGRGVVYDAQGRQIAAGADVHAALNQGASATP